MSKQSVRVTVTGAAGQIGYALLFRIASGEMFGPDVEVNLSLLELESALPALDGVRMELDDCAFPLLASVRTTADTHAAFEAADWAFLVGSVPRKKGMERSDLLRINGAIFTGQGRAIAEASKPGCRVLVVGNPCNTNALICRHAARGRDPRDFFAMTRLDQNRAVAQLAVKAGVPTSSVKNLAVWGNHSTTMFPDFAHAAIDGRPVPEVIPDRQWLETTFLEAVQKRGAAIIEARGSSSAASAANAVVGTVRCLATPTPGDACYSVAVSSDSSYGIPEGLMFSFPVRTGGEGWEIVQGIRHDAFCSDRISVTTAELLAERDAVSDLLPG